MCSLIINYKKMKLSDKITRSFLRKIWSWNEIIIPNFYFNWEMDIFRMLPSWYIYEYEIKISRADFKNDFKKACWNRNKHERLKDWKLDCNRFYFIVPRDLILIDEIPDYCWLIYFDECPKWWFFETVKNAKFLHKEKKHWDIKFISYLLTKIAYREYIKWYDVRNLRHQKEQLIEFIKENNLEVPYLF